jgi:hypothetical protein
LVHWAEVEIGVMIKVREDASDRAGTAAGRESA